MSILMQIQDAVVEASVMIRVSGGYNPDVLDDIQRRLIGTYKEVIEQRIVLNEIENMRAEDEDEPTSGMDAPVE